jgi:hypothetical protein
MPATRAPADNPVGHPPPRPEGGRQAPDPRPAGLDTQQASGSGEDLLRCLGDALDDRIAEIVDEMLDERYAANPRRRLPSVLGTVGLLSALAATVLLRHNTLAVCTIWPSAVTVCLAARLAPMPAEDRSCGGTP